MHGEIVAVHLDLDETMIPVIHRRVVRMHVAEAPARPASDDLLLDRFSLWLLL
jgi:hypothetical protein